MRVYRRRKRQNVFYIGVHINHLLGIVPSTLNPLYRQAPISYLRAPFFGMKTGLRPETKGTSPNCECPCSVQPLSQRMNSTSIISTLNARLCASLPSISPCLTAVDVSAMSTSPHNNNVILLRRLGFVPSLLKLATYIRSLILKDLESHHASSRLLFFDCQESCFLHVRVRPRCCY